MCTLGFGVHHDDELTDRLLAVYQRCRTDSARAMALEQLVRAADPFIKRVVRHFQGGALKDLEQDDALQAGRLGYLEAVRRFDASKGPLRPYAMQRIRHELQTCGERHYTIKIPRRAGLPAKVLREAEKTYARDGRDPTAQELNGHAQAWDLAAQRPRVVTSFDAPAVEGRGLHDTVGCESPNALSLLLDADTDRDEQGVRLRVSSLVAPPPRGPLMLSSDTAQVSKPEIEALNVALSPLRDFLTAREERRRQIQQRREELTRELEALERDEKATTRAIADALGAEASQRPEAPRSSTRARGAKCPGRRPAAPVRTATDGAATLRERIIDALASRPMKVLDLSDSLGARSSSVSMCLGRMLKRDEVRRKGSGRETLYSAA